MNAAEIHALQDAMRRFGGSFVRVLADAVLDYDHPHHFAVALLNAHRQADPENMLRIRMAFPDIWAMVDLSDADRLGKLQDAFPEIFAHYTKIAQEAA